MKTYGVDRKDRGCCPGHDKFPCEAYNTKASRRTLRRTTRIAHKRARARARQEIHRAQEAS